MQNSVTRNIQTLKLFYTLVFFGFGSLLPLLSVYLNEVEKLSGTQIGTIMSIGPIIMIFFQPIWGIITDWTNAPTKILTFCSILAGIFALGYLSFHTYTFIIVVAIMVAIFQSAIIPVSDSLTLTYTTKVKVNYGNIRMYGSLGFGVAVFLLGRLSELPIGPAVIFYAYFLSLTFAGLLAFRMPKLEKVTSVKGSPFSGIKELFSHRKFIIHLVITFLIFGPNLANNVYFGLFVEDRGGTYTGIGIAFLVAVLSEIPFMRVAGSWVNRIGLLPIILIAGCISMLRWILYLFEPSLTVVYVSSVVQGLSIGLFVPAALQYVREITPVHITASAVTIYSAIGNGLGNWFSTFFGGIIMEGHSIHTVYLFFAGLAAIGVLFNLWLLKEERSSSSYTSTNIEKSSAIERIASK